MGGGRYLGAACSGTLRPCCLSTSSRGRAAPNGLLRGAGAAAGAGTAEAAGPSASLFTTGTGSSLGLAAPNGLLRGPDGAAGAGASGSESSPLLMDEPPCWDPPCCEELPSWLVGAPGTGAVRGLMFSLGREVGAPASRGASPGLRALLDPQVGASSAPLEGARRGSPGVNLLPHLDSSSALDGPVMSSPARRGGLSEGSNTPPPPAEGPSLSKPPKAPPARRGGAVEDAEGRLLPQDSAVSAASESPPKPLVRAGRSRSPKPPPPPPPKAPPGLRSLPQSSDSSALEGPMSSMRRGPSSSSSSLRLGPPKAYMHEIR